MRPVLTQDTVREAISSGIEELPLQPGTIVTALARELAQKHGLRLVAGNETAQQPRQEAGRDDRAAGRDDRAAVRAAVVAALGSSPEGLDEALDKVLGKR